MGLTLICLQYFSLGLFTWFTTWGLNRVYLHFKGFFV